MFKKIEKLIRKSIKAILELKDKLSILFFNKKFFKGKNNRIFLVSDGKYKQIKYCNFCRIKLKGNNNDIFFNAEQLNIKNKNLFIRIAGDNHKINFSNTQILGKIDIGLYGKGCKIECGNNVKLCGVNFMLMGKEKPTSVIIGDNCLFSYNIEIWNTDAHYIYDENDNILNIEKDVVIGNNVWIGRNTVILKGSKIGDGCVVGCYSLIAKDFSKNEKCAIGGNPARIIKENIGHWEYEDIKK